MKRIRLILCALLVGLVATPLSGGAQVSAETATPRAGARCDKAGDVNGAFWCEAKGATLIWTDNKLQKGTYKIGAELLLSGAAAFAGVPMGRGMEKAVAEINESGFLGKGAKLQLIQFDSAGSVPNAITAANKFIADGVSGIICCSLSSQAAAVIAITKPAGMPTVIAAAVLPNLASPPFIHRTVLLLGGKGGWQPQSAALMAKALRATSAIVVVTSDNQGMVADAATYVEGLAGAGVTSITQVKTAAADTDLSGAASQIIAANPPMVVIATLGGPGSRLVKALVDRGYKGQIVGNYGLSDTTNYAIAGNSLAGVVMPTPFFAEKATNKIGKQIVSWWKANNAGAYPSVYPLQGYTAVYYLATAIKNSGDGKPANVAKAMNKIGRFETGYGTVKFERGQMKFAQTALPNYVVWRAGGLKTVWDLKPTR